MADTAMHPPSNCPKCGLSLIGEPIPEDQRHYYGGAEHFRLEIGVEIRGVYDGVLFWQCPHCGHQFPRFDRTSRIRYVAEKYMDNDEEGS